MELLLQHFDTWRREFFNPEQHRNAPLTKLLDRLAQKTTVHKAGKSSGICTVSDVEGFLPITDVEVHTSTTSVKVLVLCNSACSHSWFAEDLPTKLNVRGLPTKQITHGNNSLQVVDIRIVDL